MKLRVRFLPMAIGVAMLALGLRVADFVRSTGVAHAQQAPGANEPVPAPVELAQAPAGDDAKPNDAEAPADVTQLSASEIQVLQQLVARRGEIEKRAADLDKREALLKAAEERINAKVTEMKVLQAKVEQAIRKYDEQEEQRRQNLVRIYETMKPSEAARVFEQMDLPTLVDLVDRMNTRKVAPILAAMNPVRAKQVTTELSKRRTPADGANPPPVGG